MVDDERRAGTARRTAVDVPQSRTRIVTLLAARGRGGADEGAQRADRAALAADQAAAVRFGNRDLVDGCPALRALR